MLRRSWLYVRLGHGYTAIFLSMTNFVVITYALALNQIPLFNVLSLPIYGLLFVSAYSMVVITIGRWHKKHQYNIDTAVSVDVNPYNKRIVPGKEKAIAYPSTLIVLELLRAIAEKSGSLDDNMKRQIGVVEKRILILMEGGSVG